MSTKVGISRAPSANTSTEMVSRMPSARPRTSSGTMRWKRVSLTMPTSSEPTADAPIASIPRPSDETCPSSHHAAAHHHGADQQRRCQPSTQHQHARDDGADETAHAHRGVERTGGRFAVRLDRPKAMTTVSTPMPPKTKLSTRSKTSRPPMGMATRRQSKPARTAASWASRSGLSDPAASAARSVPVPRAAAPARRRAPGRRATTATSTARPR